MKSELKALTAMGTNLVKIAVRLITRKKAEIFGPVVRLNPVDMVDNFSGPEKTPKFLLHHKAVLSDVAFRIRLVMIMAKDINITEGQFSAAFPHMIFRSRRMLPDMANPHSLFHLFRDFSTGQEMRQTSLAESGETLIHGGFHFNFCFERMVSSKKRRRTALNLHFFICAESGLTHFFLNRLRSFISFSHRTSLSCLAY